MLRLNFEFFQNLNSVPTKALGFVGVCLLLLVVDASLDLELSVVKILRLYCVAGEV